MEQFRRAELGRFAPPSEAVPVHRRDTFRRCQAYLADASGRSVKWWLDQCPHKPFVQRTLEAALVPRDDGTTRYRLDGASPGSKRARAIVVHSILIYENTRKTKAGRVCRGLSEKYVRAVLADPYTGKQPAITTINGRHRRNGSVHNGQVGWLRALVECGALQRKQYKRQDVIKRVCQSWELSAPNKKGEVYPINWYTLPMHPADAVEKLRGAELAHWLDEFEQSAEWDAWAPNPAPPPSAQRSQAPP